MGKKSANRKSSKKVVKKIKNFFGAELQTAGPVKCPFCKELFAGVREWGLHIKEEHCR
jgi:hypothetical protein